MTIPDHAQQKIEAYLARVRAQLRGFNDQQVAEIVAELRSHVIDKLAISGDAVTPAQVDAILAALGTPEELANQYITDNLLARAEVSRSPLRILDSLIPLGKSQRRRLFRSDQYPCWDISSELFSSSSPF